MPKETILGDEGPQKFSPPKRAKNLEMWLGSLEGVPFLFDYAQKTITTPEGEVFDFDSPKIPLLVKSLYLQGIQSSPSLMQYTNEKLND